MASDARPISRFDCRRYKINRLSPEGADSAPSTLKIHISANFKDIGLKFEPEIAQLMPSTEKI